MTVYVDDSRTRSLIPHSDPPAYDNWSALTADTRDELHSFARKIKVKRTWFHDHVHGLWHYTITDEKRDEAIKAGAIPMHKDELKQFVIKSRTREGRTLKDFANCKCDFHTKNPTYSVN